MTRRGWNTPLLLFYAALLSDTPCRLLPVPSLTPPEAVRCAGPRRPARGILPAGFRRRPRGRRSLAGEAGAGRLVCVAAGQER